MPKRKSVSAKAKASAKLEATARVSYNKKVIEVIPPDVTRNKANKWLDMFSPITEWMGLRGDRLRFQRLSLRIQQEEVLERIALEVRRNLGDRSDFISVPPKFFIPLLENASLESPDSPLISWWANLLSNRALSTVPRPYFVSLMSMVGAEEAELLESMWSPERYRADVYWRDKFVQNELFETWREYFCDPSNGQVLEVQKWAAENHFHALINLYSRDLTELGTRTNPHPDHQWSALVPLGWPLDAFRVCLALSLVTRRSFEKDMSREKGAKYRRVIVDYLDYTNLGQDFMNATRPPSETTVRRRSLSDPL
jgi:hypothetical protein